VAGDDHVKRGEYTDVSPVEDLVHQKYLQGKQKFFILVPCLEFHCRPCTSTHGKVSMAYSHGHAFIILWHV